MTESGLTDALLREFLLGKVDDEARERIEGLFLTDPQARERILAAEQDLIEDYLEDSLTPADKEEFLLRYAQTSAQQRQLRINKSIKDWALRESGTTETVAVKVSPWVRLRERLSLKPALVIPIAVTTIVVLAVVAVWLSNQRKQENRRLAIEQELAELNTPARLSETLANGKPLVLSPIATRSVEGKNELNKTSDTQVFELHLPLSQGERYSSYRAEVGRRDSDQSFRIPNLKAENEDGYRIRLRLPAHLLERGPYRIRLSGINPDGSPSLAQVYTFTVSE